MKSPLIRAVPSPFFSRSNKHQCQNCPVRHQGDMAPFIRAHPVGIIPTVPLPPLGCTLRGGSCLPMHPWVLLQALMLVSRVLLLTQLLMTPVMLSLPCCPLSLFSLLPGSKIQHSNTCIHTCLPSRGGSHPLGREAGQMRQEQDSRTHRDEEQGSIRLPPSSQHHHALA